jgi:molybdate-binding protein
MTKQDLINKYKIYPTYTQIATEAFEAGLKIGKEEVKPEKVRKMEKELKELRRYQKNMEETLYDPEKLADLIGGL